jgi:imidazolonepropionase-like amidohydrolase
VIARRALILAVALGVGAWSLAPQAKYTVLRFGAIVTGQGPVIRDGIVVIEGDRIRFVGEARSPVPAGAAMVDLRPLTAIPGLIDAHTHMTYSWDRAPGTTPLKQGRRDPAKAVELSAPNAMRTLEAGVTTVRDLGASNGFDLQLRDEIADGRIVGPRMFVSGAGISAGRDGGPAVDMIAGLVNARALVGVDWIKVYASRGSFQSVDTTQTLTYDQLKAVVDAARAKQIPVAIHSYGPSGAKDAVRAGADSVEHGIDLDDETFALMK